MTQHHAHPTYLGECLASSPHPPHSRTWGSACAHRLSLVTGAFAHVISCLCRVHTQDAARLVKEGLEAVYDYNPSGKWSLLCHKVLHHWTYTSAHLLITITLLLLALIEHPGLYWDKYDPYYLNTVLPVGVGVVVCVWVWVCSLYLACMCRCICSMSERPCLYTRCFYACM